MQPGLVGAIKPEKFKYVFDLHFPGFTGVQQDVHEFLTFVLDPLIEDTRVAVSIPSLQHTPTQTTANTPYCGTPFISKEPLNPAAVPSHITRCCFATEQPATTHVPSCSSRFESLSKGQCLPVDRTMLLSLAVQIPHTCTSRLQDLFQGEYTSTLECPTCKARSEPTPQPFTALDLPLPSNDTAPSVRGCLSALLAPEQLRMGHGWVCPKCSAEASSTEGKEIKIKVQVCHMSHVCTGTAVSRSYRQCDAIHVDSTCWATLSTLSTYSSCKLPSGLWHVGIILPGTKVGLCTLPVDTPHPSRHTRQWSSPTCLRCWCCTSSALKR